VGVEALNEASVQPVIEVVCHKRWFISLQNEQAGIKERQKSPNLEQEMKSYLGFVTTSGRGFAAYG
jgi:hypothetical protein